MIRWCAQTDQATYYYQCHHVERVGYVSRTPAVFCFAFLQGFWQNSPMWIDVNDLELRSRLRSIPRMTRAVADRIVELHDHSRQTKTWWTEWTASAGSWSEFSLSSVQPKASPGQQGQRQRLESWARCRVGKKIHRQAHRCALEWLGLVGEPVQSRHGFQLQRGQPLFRHRVPRQRSD
jgi:hypothetical protein